MTTAMTGMVDRAVMVLKPSIVNRLIFIRTAFDPSPIWFSNMDYSKSKYITSSPGLQDATQSIESDINYVARSVGLSTTPNQSRFFLTIQTKPFIFRNTME
ncbi:MAG: hypothetical protein WAO19_13960 [Candidatus Kryptoniota bacterium]